MSKADVLALISAFEAGKLHELLIEEIRLPDDFTRGTMIVKGAEIPVKGGILRRITPLPLEPGSVQPKETKKQEPKTKQ